MSERVEELIRILGRHEDAASPFQLTLPELGSLVIGAGCAAGFIVQVEVPVPGTQRDARLDCAWLAADKTMVVAWEFDGRDVKRPHIAGDPEKGRLGNREKFQRSRALVKVQALYSLRNERVLPPMGQGTGVLGPEVIVLRDEDLMRGEIQTVMERARAAAERAGLALLCPTPG